MCVCVCGGDAHVTHVHFDRVHAIATTAPDLGTFTPLPPAVLDRFVQQGIKSARELDAQIAPMFVMGPEANLRLR